MKGQLSGLRNISAYVHAGDVKINKFIKTSIYNELIIYFIIVFLIHMYSFDFILPMFSSAVLFWFYVLSG